MRRLLLSLALAATILAAPHAAAKVAQPTPTVGDFWETRSAFGRGDEGAAQNATTQNTITAFETIVVEGETYDAVRYESFSNTSSTVTGFEMTTTSHITSWTRRSDGAALRTVSVISFGGLPGLGGGGETRAETTYETPCRHLTFPFDVGQSWNVTCTSRTTTASSFPGQPATNTTSNESYEVRALRSETVRVPAGAFDTVVLAWNATSDEGSSTYYQWYAAEACGVVRSASDPEGANLTSELTRFACASPGGEGGDEPSVTTPGGAGSRPTPPGSTPTFPATTPATASPTITSPFPGEEPGLPGPGVFAVLAALGAAALVARRRRA